MSEHRWRSRSGPLVAASDEGIWATSQIYSKPFTYSDGQRAEAKLAEILRSVADLCSDSMELEQRIDDFHTRYHLSSQRANLLRPFLALFEGKRVLEVGAGCGALTRFLGETAAEVWALDGSWDRAQMCRARCRDLPNVSVLCADICDVEAVSPFDVIILVGVLEYSHLYLGKNGSAIP